jgi:hypothetical protein
MRVWGKLGMTCQGRAVADARVVLATKHLVTAGHADFNGQSLGVIVGNWGIGRKVVTIGAGIGDACMMSWKRRGRVGTNLVARA